MATFNDEVEDGSVPSLDPDFTAGPFVTQREPLQELIQSLGSLYLESDNEADDGELELLPPPPPPPVDEDEESLISLAIASKVHCLEVRLDMLEADSAKYVKDTELIIQRAIQPISSQLSDVQRQIKDLAKQQESLKQMQKRQGTERDEKLAGMVKKDCNLVKQKCESSIKELGEAIMDCLKRRDAKLKSLIQSTPVAISTPVTHLASAASAVQTSGSCFHSFPNKAAIKLEFPRFGSMEGEDPIDYLEKCEE